MIRSIAAFALAAVAVSSVAQSNVVGARSLAISPDGSRLAYVHRGDLWVAPATGGLATPITTHVEQEEAPVWSPDGRQIAFSSNRFGSYDIFVAPAEGGEVRRITTHSENESPSDWTPDGKAILFRGQRGDVYTNLYTVDIESRKLRRITRDFQGMGRSSIALGAHARFSPDGRQVLFPRQGFIWWRPRYQGSAAQQLWTLDLPTGKRSQLRNNGFQHLWPAFGPEGRIYTVTVTEVTPSVAPLGKSVGKWTDSAARTPNLYEIDARGGAKRLTDFVGGGVRWMSVAKKSGRIAFDYEGDVYTMEPGGKPRKIELTAVFDDKLTNEERLVLTSGAEDGALSPTGDRVAFVMQGELWLVPVKKGRGPNADDATQLTRYAGLDQDPVWAPDGKFLFFTSDRDGEERLYRLELETNQVEPISKVAADVRQVKVTPDRKGLSFFVTGGEGGLFLLPLDSTNAKRVVPGTGNQGLADGYDWSPDMRYVAFSKYVSQNNINVPARRNLWIHEVESGKQIQATRLFADHSDPTWSPDGRSIFFRSNRQGLGLYLLPLTTEAARATELEVKYEEPKAPVKVEIEQEDIDYRVRKLVDQPVDGNIRIDPASGEVLFLAGGNLWRCDHAGEGARALSTAGGIRWFEFTANRSDVFFVREGALQTLSLRQNGNPISTISFRADWTRDLRAVRQAAFTQFWRIYNVGFYDPNFHGRDWVGVRKRYERLLPAVGHRNDFSTLLSMMVGELEASHTEPSPADGNPTAPATAHLGFEIDPGYDGPGLRIAQAPRRSPGSYTKTKLEPGEIVLQVNGQNVGFDENLWTLLAGQAGRDVVLRVNKTASLAGSREVKYRALSEGEWGTIVFRNEIERRRAVVDAKSKGTIAYVQIPGMGQSNYDNFNLEVYEFIQGKKALIIDVRGNGGGNIADRLIDQLEQRPHSFVAPRNDRPGVAPPLAVEMPIVVIHSESSLSNAEMFPAAMRTRGFATLVGMPTPGYVIWTYGARLVDGTGARMPNTGAFRLDGTPMENQGQQPDHKVDWTNEQFFRGDDPQLDKAIEVLLGKVK